MGLNNKSIFVHWGHDIKQKNLRNFWIKRPKLIDELGNFAGYKFNI